MMWAQMEDIPAIMDSRQEIQGAQEKLTRINEEIVVLTPLQKLVRLKETRHLQEDIQTLRAKEIEVLKQLQPWQDEVSDMALNIESKLREYKNTKQTSTSLLEEPTTVDVVEAAQESVAQIIQEVVALTQNCEGFKQRMLDEAEK